MIRSRRNCALCLIAIGIVAVRIDPSPASDGVRAHAVRPGSWIGQCSTAVVEQVADLIVAIGFGAVRPAAAAAGPGRP